MSMMHPTIRRFTALLLTGLMLLSMAAPIAAQGNPAGMVATETLVEEMRGEQMRAELQAFLARDEVRDQLARLGVDPTEAEQRVDLLTDQEVAEMHGRLEDLPAGAGLGTVVGAAVLIFLVLLVTDILGFTDVYPFVTRTAN
ncbi:PA2779 family protein [Alkalilimnicola ehrlichii MLHE-1]|uniref:PA2779 family protein n=1 Tax=Alkalilimnicola ehrlichii (strain ATCC BAA-1101 / DSM 17681 / MLHE-1) TaxID=187272 RepID=Q0ABA2_ALKEH|nr:PA2779 family protein [Alkalilimnicola ehrlichii]ABI55885.1 hypothetical protein Mlg_0531 [Alkalilimnicola ehrlichii MLHE-1]